MAGIKVREYKSQIISGKFLNLRIANEGDAEFILSLRLNPLLNKFVGHTDPSVEKQRVWINEAFTKENDFMFIIEDKKSNKCGTVAVYDIDYIKKRAEWGRLILKQDTLFTIPIEATIQLLNFAFNKLKLIELYGGANNENRAVVQYHKKYANVTAEDEKFTWFSFDEKSLMKLKNMYKNIHNIQF